MNGSQQALDLIARVLIEPGDRVAIEDPSYQGSSGNPACGRGAVASCWSGQGWIESGEARSRNSNNVCHPSHQFPTGAILPLARRLALLKWANERMLLLWKMTTMASFATATSRSNLCRVWTVKDA